MDNNTVNNGNKQIVNITPQIIAALVAQGKVRDCQRKKYDVYGTIMPAGLIFANRLEQPKSYKLITQTFKRAVIKREMLSDTQYKQLKELGIYETDGHMVTLCGTVGELWTVKPEKLVNSYTNVDGSRITSGPNKWTTYTRAGETTPQAKGIQLPAKFIGKLQTDWALLTVNDTNSPGHGFGDILVIDKENNISPTNNAVFANTYNLTIGGWAQSGQIQKIADNNKITLTDVENKWGKYRDIIENTQTPSLVMPKVAQQRVQQKQAVKISIYDVEKVIKLTGKIARIGYSVENMEDEDGYWMNLPVFSTRHGTGRYLPYIGFLTDGHRILIDSRLYEDKTDEKWIASDSVEDTIKQAAKQAILFIEAFRKTNKA